MANNWKIPTWLEMEVRARDTLCVYCGCKFLPPKESAKFSASWEHIINDETIITRENIALCCRGCNASKGQKSVSDWLRTKYCIERGITAESVAPIIKEAIANGQ
jgi:5-methylcytosine-specific restriction endonuclease McrA